ncbi:MAG: division/cell wall cluster transcriptional repressor MraZ [Chitinivibrionales bacterium]
MSRFRGRFDYSIDAKGRLNFPAKFRKALAPEAAETFVICRAPGGCLRAYPQDAWERYEDELDTMPQTPEAVKFQRLLYSTVSDSSLDSQGRIMLTPKQLEIAGIKKNVTLIGKRGHVEIWDTNRFEEYIGAGDDFDDVFFQSVEAGMR